MKVILFITFMCINSVGYTQNTSLTSEQLAKKPVFTSLAEALRTPKDVYKMRLNDGNLSAYPPEISQFKNLVELYLIC